MGRVPSTEVFSMPKIKIYTTPSCPWCAKTKEWLRQHKIPYTNLDVTKNPAAREEMFQKSGQMGVPVLDVNDTTIVGYDPQAIVKALKRKK